MKYFEALSELGLDESEIKVYTACLSEKGISAKEIAQKTRLIRTTVYDIIESLKTKGLISSAKQNSVSVFRSTSPDELLNIIDEKMDKIAEIVPELNKILKVSGSLQGVDFYEGEKGVLAITNDTISKPNQIVKILGSTRNWLDFAPGFAVTYYRKKNEGKISTKTILNDSASERTIIKEGKVKNSDFRFIDGLHISSGAVFVYQDKVSFASYEHENPRGFIIQDSEFNKMLNVLFDNLWDKAKK